MKAIVLADRLGEDIAPLNNRCCAALLPVAGKPVLEYSLEELSEAGIRQSIVVVSSHTEQVQQVIGDGSRWGLQIEYFLSRGEESPDRLLPRMGIGIEDEHLLLRGDVLRSYMVREFLDDAENLLGEYVEGRFEKGVTGLMLIRKPGGYVKRIGWPLAFNRAPLADGGRLKILHGKLSQLNGLSEYHRVNLMAVAGEFAGILLPGEKKHPGIRVGAQTRVDHSQFQGGAAVLGKQVQIDHSVSLHGNIVIGDESTIEAGTRIENSVVMPGTFVGADLNIQNAIVAPGLLIRVDTGVVVRVEDPAILADMGRMEITDHIKRSANQFLAIIMLILSAPLWAIALLLAVILNGRKVLLSQSVVSNRMVLNAHGQSRHLAFNDWSWNLNNPVLRHLPRLLAAARGHLQIVGRRPRVINENASETDFETGEGNEIYGLIGPAQLILTEDAPTEEIVLTEALFSAQRTLRNDLFYVLLGIRVLLSPGTWLGNGLAQAGVTNTRAPGSRAPR
jgi:NDP-sugar pyrophosphorylase family protein